MPDSDQYKKSHRNTLSVLDYRFLSHGHDLLEALFGDILEGRVKTTANWNPNEQKVTIYVHTMSSSSGQSLLLDTYKVYIENNEIVLEKVDTVYGLKKATDYTREIKRIPIKK